MLTPPHFWSASFLRSWLFHSTLLQTSIDTDLYIRPAFCSCGVRHQWPYHTPQSLLVCPLLIFPCVIVPPHHETITHQVLFSSPLCCLSPFPAFHSGFIDCALVLSPPWNCCQCSPSSHHPAFCSLTTSPSSSLCPHSRHCKAKKKDQFYGLKLTALSMIYDKNYFSNCFILLLMSRIYFSNCSCFFSTVAILAAKLPLSLASDASLQERKACRCAALRYCGALGTSTTKSARW